MTARTNAAHEEQPDAYPRGHYKTAADFVGDLEDEIERRDE